MDEDGRLSMAANHMEMSPIWRCEHVEGIGGDHGEHGRWRHSERLLQSRKQCGGDDGGVGERGSGWKHGWGSGGGGNDDGGGRSKT